MTNTRFLKMTTRALAMAVIGAAGSCAIGSGGLLGTSRAEAASQINFNLAWGPVTLPDTGSPIALSSPNVAQLAGGPAVVVGDQAGYVYAYHLADGSAVSGWPFNAGAPINSSPSVAALGSGGLDMVFVGTGDAANPHTGGYQAINPNGTGAWFHQETDPLSGSTVHNGVQAGIAIGNLQGSVDAIAGSLGQNEDAFNASSGSLLPGFQGNMSASPPDPEGWFQADTSFSTPALAQLDLDGHTWIVNAGASSPGMAYNYNYPQGGHLTVLGANGNLGQPEPNDGARCGYNTDQEIDSSPAVGEFLGGGAVGIVFGTGTYWQGASDTNRILAINTSCNLVWSDLLDGSTASSPALADVLGNGSLQVIEGTSSGSSGSVWALNGSNGATIWRTTVGPVIGSVVTADLGTGYQDVMAPTTNGVDILDGKSGAIVGTLAPYVGVQNAPLVTNDPNGTIGITVAGYNASNQGVIYHYELPGSSGAVVNETGAWPQFHHDPQLTGNAGTPTRSPEVPCNPPAPPPAGYYLVASDGGLFDFGGNLPFCGSMGGFALNAPVVGMTATRDGGGYWELASDGGIFAFGDAQSRFYGSMGGKPLNAPIVGMAPTISGGGYWLVASDGGIFAFGDASFYGSMGGHPLNAPVVGMAADPANGGYWLVASDGGIFAFGGAPFYGSMGGKPLNAPIVGMTEANGGSGYWFVAADGGIFAYGTAQFYGSMGGKPLNAPVVGMTGF